MKLFFWLKSLCQLRFVYFFGFYFWYFQNPKIEPPNPKNTNQNPKKLPHSSLASIKIQTIPPI
ncbi:hypothetical protein AZO1586R_353 [Bathymodiolus azoricus thioautotrophic gill symbiont]|uniref:Uncharacterized protein n=1 Tax=Bathymodiolus azoricus thioautotrophic gill symbiont TaxID=235205 RepID=A0ACA8ZVW9_9GAMM|nr:hypothetical protein AZO1586R_353 [Bathymodiolus azoricus thioautotrophic gill symbiont]